MTNRGDVSAEEYRQAMLKILNDLNGQQQDQQEIHQLNNDSNEEQSSLSEPEFVFDHDEDLSWFEPEIIVEDFEEQHFESNYCSNSYVITRSFIGK